MILRKADDDNSSRKRMETEKPRRTPLISIITVVYNGVTKLESTLLSVFAQTYTDYEFIIIDGGSTDGTLDIIKRYKRKIDVSISEPDRGIYDAMNKGIRHVSGNWILFLNAGDQLYNNETLERVKKFTHKHSASDLFFGDVSIVQPDNSESIRKLSNTIVFLLRNMICHQCIFYSKESFSKIGFFNLNYRLAADFDHFVRARWDGGLKIRKIPEVISRYKLDGISSRKENIPKIWKERVRIFSQKPKKMNSLIYYLFLTYSTLAYQFRKVF